MNKLERYKKVLNVIKSVTESETNLIANLANSVAVIKEEFNFFWIGFYLVDENRNQLILGPFQGTLACTRIPFGKGVCGNAWKDKTSLIVDNVDLYEGHIACSSLSKSEIVIPIINSQKVIGLLDIDSDQINEFDDEDQAGLEEICLYLSSVF